MRLVTFKGGIHPPYNKDATNSCRIISLPAGKKVYIPLVQHIGAPCESLVKKGDYVKVGQKIGDSEAFVSSPVHSSVSGNVLAVEKHLHPNSTFVETAVIENDGENVISDELKGDRDYNSMTPDEIKNAIHEAGIVGMGGAGFPMHIKINPPKGKTAEYLIINGAECEPYLSSDHRAMVECAEMIVFGVRTVMKATGAKKAIIAIEDNKRDAENILSELTQDDDTIEVCLMETKYPQGSEKHVIKAVLDREVPSGGLPIDVGVIVNNIDTCIAVANALKSGMPIVRRRVTVSGGAVAHPGVFEVPIGVPFSEVIEAAGGLSSAPKKILMGGPMMGIAQYSLDVPVIKTTSGILALSRSELRGTEAQPCLRCGKCVEACPMNLMPLKLLKAGKTSDAELAAEYNALDCIECGSCSYTCPANRPLVENIRLAKAIARQAQTERK